MAKKGLSWLGEQSRTENKYSPIPPHFPSPVSNVDQFAASELATLDFKMSSGKHQSQAYKGLRHVVLRILLGRYCYSPFKSQANWGSERWRLRVNGLSQQLVGDTAGMWTWLSGAQIFVQSHYTEVSLTYPAHQFQNHRKSKTVVEGAMKNSREEWCYRCKGGQHLCGCLLYKYPGSFQ